jgi:signal recognition particle subunit SRP54
MFDNLTDRLQQAFRRLRGYSRLSEKNISDALREVRLALLEADVNFRVVKHFINTVKERAIGAEVMKSLTPGQQVIKIVNEELTRLMGGSRSKLAVAPRPPSVYMMVGLQGSGKTTSSAKLAMNLRKEGRKPLLVAADVYRPAAIQQLVTLGKQIGVEVYATDPSVNPIKICTDAVAYARESGFDAAILDTAGRLHIDERLMQELQAIRNRVTPTEILFVADAMTGQDAVNVAEKFNNDLGIDGVILTKMDGDARGGAAISIKSVTGKPIKFVSMGEKITPLDPFHPDRMASRILGMGDVLTLIEKAEAAISQEQALELQRKMREESFTLDDFREQLRQVRAMGPLDQLLSLIPGIKQMSGLDDLSMAEDEFKVIEAIINSMTPQERADHTIINSSRRRRIAKGSGRSLAEVNRLLKQFVKTRRMMKSMAKGGMMKPRMKRRKRRR